MLPKLNAPKAVCPPLLSMIGPTGVNVRPVLAGTYGAEQETLWLVNWRLFFLVCSEVWNLGGGQEYLVSHYPFGKQRD